MNQTIKETFEMDLSCRRTTSRLANLLEDLHCETLPLAAALRAMILHMSDENPLDGDDKELGAQLLGAFDIANQISNQLRERTDEAIMVIRASLEGNEAPYKLEKSTPV